MTDFNATNLVDTPVLTAGNDKVIFTNVNQANAGDVFNGGGTDSIVINASGVNLAPVSLSGFESIELGFGGSVQLTAAQVSAAFPSNLSVTGTAGSTQSILVNGASAFSAAAWTFSNWNPDEFDLILILGTGGVRQHCRVDCGRFSHRQHRRRHAHRR